MGESIKHKNNVHVSISIAESIKQKYSTCFNAYGRIYYTEIMYMYRYLLEILINRIIVHAPVYMGEPIKQKYCTCINIYGRIYYSEILYM